MQPLNIDYPFSENTWLDNLPAYNANVGVDSLLDLYREIQQSGNYYYSGLVFPNLQIQPTIPAQGTLQGVITVPPGSYVTGIAAHSGSSNGFNLKLYDKGSKASIFYSSYAQHYVVTGEFGTTEDVPTGPALLKSPFILTGPGILGWEIVNLSSDANQIQVLVDCAIPVTNRSIGNMVVNR